jgi:hypothetical protein
VLWEISDMPLDYVLAFATIRIVRMSENKDEPLKPRRDTGASQIIGFRLPVPLAKAIKAEATRRQLPLNGLLAEMWQLYSDGKRAD